MSHNHTPRVQYDDSPIDATITSKAFWEQTIDRSVKTALQSLAVFLGGGTGLLGIDWTQALTATGVTVLITVIMAASSAKLYEVESFSVDLLQRAARTFVATATGAVVALESFDGIDWNNILSAAGSATLLSLITSYLSRNVGVPGTASVLRGAELVRIAPNQFVPAPTARDYRRQ